MKKLLSLCLSSIVIMGVLAGCGNDNTTSKDEGEKQSETKADTEKQASEDVEVDKEEKQTDEDKAVEDTTETTAEVTNSVDFTQALDPKKPVPFGEYMNFGMYAVEDSKYHTVYVKLNKITSESDDAEYVKKAIAENNAEGYDFDEINREALGLPDDVELNVLDYEVVIPKDFPAPEYGISGLKVDFLAENIEGGGIPSNNGNAVYLSLGMGDELLSTGARDKIYMPGNTYKLRGYFKMVKGYDQYVIQVSAFPDGSKDSSGLKDAYFDIK
ncbi:hypothetical protein [Bacillus massiliigorillae]|uniref:hypothetical protein n=1 Tax=Bacillus massiliigorillae TaxID=1243664 RepID=UPI0003A1EDAF|nr:hypothetical protein [Bacillus massiliigorillae]